ncbi:MULTISPECIES: WhiB family transcriptional regulator [Corynebacterium]|uniref:WhiB family transcriptional regulator n=1 Tax=Corynebacterium TaxID=1716 RepID=UPI001CEF89F6|nr:MULTISPECIES: WhiB family transcriptional regulator [Corynebacterium]
MSSVEGDYPDTDAQDHGDATTRSAAAESSYGELSFDDLFGAVEQEWHDQALCAQTDPEAFFPEKGGSTREAKRICKACGVRDECLEYALLHDERFGIWGGLSERERRRLKKQLG